MWRVQLRLVWNPKVLSLRVGWSAGVAAGFNAPISGVFFAVETVLQRQLLAGKEDDRPRGSRGNIGDPSGGTSSGLTVAMVLLASVLAAIASQVWAPLCCFFPACMPASRSDCLLLNSQILHHRQE